MVVFVSSLLYPQLTEILHELLISCILLFMNVDAVLLHHGQNTHEGVSTRTENVVQSFILNFIFWKHNIVPSHFFRVFIPSWETLLWAWSPFWLCLRNTDKWYSEDRHGVESAACESGRNGGWGNIIVFSSHEYFWTSLRLWAGALLCRRLMPLIAAPSLAVLSTWWFTSESTHSSRCFHCQSYSFLVHVVSRVQCLLCWRT